MITIYINKYKRILLIGITYKNLNVRNYWILSYLVVIFSLVVHKMMVHVMIDGILNSTNDVIITGQ